MSVYTCIHGGLGQDPQRGQTKTGTPASRDK